MESFGTTPTTANHRRRGRRGRRGRVGDCRRCVSPGSPNASHISANIEDMQQNLIAVSTGMMQCPTPSVIDKCYLRSVLQEKSGHRSVAVAHRTHEWCHASAVLASL